MRSMPPIHMCANVRDRATLARKLWATRSLPAANRNVICIARRESIHLRLTLLIYWHNWKMQEKEKRERNRRRRKLPIFALYRKQQQLKPINPHSTENIAIAFFLCCRCCCAWARPAFLRPSYKLPSTSAQVAKFYAQLWPYPTTSISAERWILVLICLIRPLKLSEIAICTDLLTQFILLEEIYYNNSYLDPQHTYTHTCPQFISGIAMFRQNKFPLIVFDYAWRIECFCFAPLQQMEKSWNGKCECEWAQ